MLLNDEMSLNDRMTQWLTSVTLEIRFMTLNMFVGRNLPIVILGRPYSFYSAGVNEQLSSYLLTLITTDKNLHMTHSYTWFFIIRQRGQFIQFLSSLSTRGEERRFLDSFIQFLSSLSSRGEERISRFTDLGWGGKAAMISRFSDSRPYAALVTTPASKPD